MTPCKRHPAMADIVEDLRSRFGTALWEAKQLLRTLQQGKRTYHQLGEEVSRLVNMVYGEGKRTETLKVEQFTGPLNNVSCI